VPEQACGRRWHHAHRVPGAERYSAGIFDGHMDKLPASTVLPLLAVARNAVAGLAKTPQLLDVQMQ